MILPDFLNGNFMFSSFLFYILLVFLGAYVEMLVWHFARNPDICGYAGTIFECMFDLQPRGQVSYSC